MVATILVPLDGSPLAERAIPYAARLAHAMGARLMFVRCASAYLSSEEPERELTAVAARVRADGTEADSRLLPIFAGEVAQSIVDAAVEHHARMIVMSTHGRGGLGRWLYGSVADQVLRRATVPVVLVPAATDHAWTPDGPPRILVPLDGSSLAETTLDPVTEVAKTLGASLLLVQAVEVPGQIYVEYPSVAFDLESQVAVAEEYLAAVARRLRTDGLTVETYAPVGHAPTAIAAAAAERDVDLIAMATHGRGGLARLVLGSVATGTLQRAHVPVLLYHPTPVPPATANVPEATAEAVPEPVGPTATLTLTAREIDVIERGLTSLLFMPGQDWATATPVRDLLARVRAIDEELSGRATGAVLGGGRR